MRGLSAVALAAPVVGAIGCAQVFGINTTSELPTPPEATLQIQHLSIGATVVAAPQDVTMQTATFYLPDAVDPAQLDATPAMQSATDTWSGAVPPGNPSVAFTLPDLPMPWLHVYALDNRAMKGSFTAYEHPYAQPAPAATIEHIAMTLPTPVVTGEAFQADVIGTWMTGGLPTPALNSTTLTADVDYSKFAQMTASPSTRISANDAFLVLRYVGNALTGVYQQPGFDQSDTMDTISGTMTEVAQTKTLDIMYDPMVVQSRFAAVRPAVSGFTFDWAITAAPGYSIGDPTGVKLQAGAASTTTMMTMASYGNPFESLGWNAVLELVATEGRTITVGGVMTSAGAVLATFTDAATAGMMTLATPLVQGVSLDQHQLFSDNSNVPLDTTLPHAVSLSTETTPAATVYTVTVTDLVVTAGVLDRKIVASAISTSPTVTLPPNVFAQTHTYVITGGAIVGGNVDAATGDLQTHSFPLTIGQIDSGVFTVVAP